MDLDAIAQSWDAQARSVGMATAAAASYSKASVQIAAFLRRLASMPLAKAEPLLDRFIMYGDYSGTP